MFPGPSFIKEGVYETPDRAAIYGVYWRSLFQPGKKERDSDGLEKV